MTVGKTYWPPSTRVKRLGKRRRLKLPSIGLAPIGLQWERHTRVNLLIHVTQSQLVLDAFLMTEEDIQWQKTLTTAVVFMYMWWVIVFLCVVMCVLLHSVTTETSCFASPASMLLVFFPFSLFAARSFHCFLSDWSCHQRDDLSRCGVNGHAALQLEIRRGFLDSGKEPYADCKWVNPH